MDGKENFYDEEEEEVVRNSNVTSTPNPLPKVLNIGVGQGGSRIALSMGSAFKSLPECLYLNTSEKDNFGISNSADTKRIMKIGGKSVEGTGKDRSVAEKMLKKEYLDIIEKLKVYVNEKAYDFIFVSFSTAGGTGSGIGPKLTALLNSEQFMAGLDPKVYGGKIPLVFGIAATPEISSTEGNLSYENTLECLEDIDKQASRDMARYIIINNGGVPNKNKTERTSQLETVNYMVATTIKRYLMDYGVSRVSNLDKADRYGALNTMGLHSFVTFYEDGSKAITPFIIPNGERVRRVCCEVPKIFENKTLSFTSSNGIFADDTILGLYDMEMKENKGLIPIVAFHGFKNTAKIAEMFNNRLKLNKEHASKIEEENTYSSTGLDDVEIERQTRDKEYGRNAAKSFEDIF